MYSAQFMIAKSTTEALSGNTLRLITTNAMLDMRWPKDSWPIIFMCGMCGMRDNKQSVELNVKIIGV